MVAEWVAGSTEPPERFHRRLIEELEFTPEELAALTGEPVVVESEPVAVEAEEELVEPKDIAAEPEVATAEPERDPEPPPAPEPASAPATRGSGMSVGRAIQEARRRKGWTTRELASAIHYRRSEVESWEDGDAVPWKFAIRSMLEKLDFTDDEAAAVRDATDEP